MRPLLPERHRLDAADCRRLRRAAEQLRLLGSRVLFEMLLQVGRHCGCLTDLLDTLDQYNEIRPDPLYVIRGEGFPPLQPDLVPQ